ncbi:MAG: YtfJ family protein [Halieaceae bacterium]|jgi:YtfJ family uncharacterized protein|nr:YtfJ family protein [Halieaceae bacterium]
MIRFFVLLLFAAALPAQAADVTIGEPLTPLAISDKGELLFDGEEFRYQDWELPTAGLGKAHILQYMAATMTARGQTQAFTDALEANFPTGTFHVTTVLNLDQALWGTSGFVKSKVRSNKKQYPQSTIVLDEDGIGQATWSLAPKDAAVVIMDTGGTVLYFQEGVMDDADIAETLKLLQQQLNQD